MNYFLIALLVLATGHSLYLISKKAFQYPYTKSTIEDRLKKDKRGD